MKRRLAAIAALLLMAASIVLAAVLAVQLFPRGLTVFACLAVAVAAAWWALLRRGLPRLLVQQWAAPAFEVESDRRVAAGIDGEAVQLDPPLRFRTRPAALRVRVAPQHPGASPSATIPAGGWDAVRGILRVTAFGSL